MVHQKERPIEVPTLEESIAFSAIAHKGQLDKNRQPYILHPIRVMLMMLTFAERTVAILHDVVEDTGVTLEDLRAKGYPENIVQGVDSVTKRDGESYEDFVRRAAKDPIGSKVKKADILDNISPMRQYSLSPAHSDRLKTKYVKALDILREAELEDAGEE